MTKVNTNLKKDFQSTIAIIGWTAVFLKFYLIIKNRVAGILETICRFFSFFITETNILVAICFTYLRIKPNSKIGLFFGNFKIITAVTLYILIVVIVCKLILRFLWQSTEFQQVASDMLHSAILILVTVYWIWSIKKNNLIVKNIIPWLILPSLFLTYTLIRRHFFGFYPYPFADVLILEHKTALISSFFIVLAFFLVGTVLVFISKKIR